MRIAMFCFLTLALVGIPGYAGCAPTTPAAPVESRTKPVDAPAKKTWEQDWNTTLARAREERELLAIGDSLSNVKRMVATGFQQKYGIDVNILSSPANQVAERMSREQIARISSVDVVVTGAYGLLTLLKPKDLISPLDNTIILPEVLDPGNWFGKKFPWLDAEHYQVMSGGAVNSAIWVNTELVGKGEIKEYRDLLNPKWKGKIIMIDPTVAGGGSIWFRLYYPLLGEDYMKNLIKQDPNVTRDKRLLAEWLARGKYSIELGSSDITLFDFQKAGAPIAPVETKEGEYIGTNAGSLGIPSNPLHPNAAKVFINWLLTREGQTLWSEEMQFPSFRVDVPTGHLNPAWVPQTGKVYLMDTADTLARSGQYTELCKQIFGPVVGK